MNRSLIKRFAPVGVGLTMVFSLLGGVAADPFPASNPNACANVGGVWSQSGSGNSRINSCVVAGEPYEVMTRAAGESGRGWVVVLQDVTTYEMGPGLHQQGVQGQPIRTTVETIKLDCLNPGGQSVDSPDNPHCSI